VTNKELAVEIISKVGGRRNIKNLVHCATRLRFILRKSQLADTKALEKTEGILGVVDSKGSYQVVIGNNVQLIYKEIVDITDMQIDEGNENAGARMKVSVIDRIMQVMSGTLSPYIGILAATGIIKGFLTMLTSFGLASGKEPIFLALAAAGNAIFYFFPVLLGFTSAKHFGANPYIGAIIGAALLEPNILAIGAVGETVSLLGIPMVVYNFSSTVFPIIIAIFVYSFLEKFLIRHLPGAFKVLFTPLICLVIMVPLTLVVFGPIGMVFSNMIAGVYTFLNDLSPIIANAIMAAVFIFTVMFGFHMGLIAVMITNFAANGTDTLIGATGLANYAVMGVMIAYAILSRNKANRGVASAAAFSLFIAGISEPGLYGICVRYKKTFLSVIIAGLIGGALYGAFGCFGTDFSFTGILGLGVFYNGRFGRYLISVGVTILVAFICTFLFGTGEAESEGTARGDGLIKFRLSRKSA
jgi:PTS system beta-glucosides-specific IIC component